MFDAIEFKDLVELIARVSRYKALREEKNERNAFSLKAYYNDPNNKVDATEIIGKEPFTYKGLVKKNVCVLSHVKSRGHSKSVLLMFIKRS